MPMGCVLSGCCQIRCSSAGGARAAQQQNTGARDATHACRRPHAAGRAARQTKTRPARARGMPVDWAAGQGHGAQPSQAAPTGRPKLCGAPSLARARGACKPHATGSAARCRLLLQRWVSARIQVLLRPKRKSVKTSQQTAEKRHAARSSSCCALCRCGLRHAAWQAPPPQNKSNHRLQPRCIGAGSHTSTAGAQSKYTRAPAAAPLAACASRKQAAHPDSIPTTSRRRAAAAQARAQASSGAPRCLLNTRAAAPHPPPQQPMGPTEGSRGTSTSIWPVMQKEPAVT